MKHFIAFGNSDQESFRSEAVREAIDYLTVPGTIAAYYPDGTAGFVLSSGLEYVIDPRTPLFQGEIEEPRASHYSLAERYGASLATMMGSSTDRLPVIFEPTGFSSSVIQEMVTSSVQFQREYGSQRTSPKARAAFEKYQTILVAAGRPRMSEEDESRPPAFVLAPYFVATSPDDAWAKINAQIWATCSGIADPATISPVVAVERVEDLRAALTGVPSTLSDDAFFWVPSFQERRVHPSTLVDMRQTVAEYSQRFRLVNLYGGFFSICMSLDGLAGFNNGLGYSESRDWPELSATGAAPARYYVRALHQFATPGIAELIVRLEPWLRCPCRICDRVGPRLLSLSYADLKQHFAYARRWELDLVEAEGREGICAHLDESAGRFESVRGRVPRGTHLVEATFLRRWIEALTAD